MAKRWPLALRRRFTMAPGELMINEISSAGFLSGFNIERPSLNGHVPFNQEIFKVFSIDAVVSAGQPEGL
jgi:hypothetical protein